MFNAIDNFIDRITMYRLVLYYLIGLVLAAIGLAFFKDISYSASSITLSTLILVVACLAVNKTFAAIFKAPTNFESVYITALILALIITPMSSYTLENIALLLAASGLAMASKYIITIGEKHIFNPAAIAMVLMALGPKQAASWWIGTAALLPFVLIGGFLMVRKLRRWPMVLTFFATALIATVVYNLIGGSAVMPALSRTLSTSAMFFLGFVMLTEPLTTPPTVGKQVGYAALVGLMFPPQFHIFSQYFTPEIALVTGNLFSYLISPKTKIFPRLVKINKLTPDTLDFIFEPKKNFKYKPGQYMEWTLPHKYKDSRGDRRVFTLASSPTEKYVHVGVKFYKPSSSFKKAMLAMKDNTPIVATQIAGDFTLPKDQSHKLAFIAGGIGVTPFRSMTKYMIDTNQSRPLTMLYSARRPSDFAYKEVFEIARDKLGMKVVYTVTDQDMDLPDSHTRNGMINAAMIKSEIPDYLERTFYLSGTHQMVLAIQNILTAIGVPRTQIKTDFFPGYI